MSHGVMQNADNDRCFADHALALAGLAGRNLGWRPDDFWHATPVELLAMLGLFSQQSDGKIGSDTLDSLLKEFPDG